jgi:hypothetical protein
MDGKDEKDGDFQSESLKAREHMGHLKLNEKMILK